jgi:hypothetical protein
MKTRLVFEVDNIALFDSLKKMKGDTSAIGSRLVETMRAAQNVSLSTAIGMGFYGIELLEAVPVLEHIEVKTVAVGANISFTTSDEGGGP